jgi:hypothetical protein
MYLSLPERALELSLHAPGLCALVAAPIRRVPTFADMRRQRHRFFE